MVHPIPLLNTLGGSKTISDQAMDSQNNPPYLDDYEMLWLVAG